MAGVERLELPTSGFGVASITFLPVSFCFAAFHFALFLHAVLCCSHFCVRFAFSRFGPCCVFSVYFPLPGRHFPQSPSGYGVRGSSGRLARPGGSGVLSTVAISLSGRNNSSSKPGHQLIQSYLTLGSGENDLLNGIFDVLSLEELAENDSWQSGCETR